MQHAPLGQYFNVHEYSAPSSIAASKHIFIFGGWLTMPFYYSRLIRQLWRHGFDCTLYIPKRKLVAIGSEYANILRAADAATRDVQQQLVTSAKSGPTVVLGVSLGSIFAMEAAKRIAEVRRVALLTPTGDFIEHVKAWQRHFYFKKIVASQPTSLLASGELLNKIGSLKNLELIKDKEVLLGFAAKDDVMHQAIAKELIAKLREAQVVPVVVEVKGGHNTGLFRYLFNSEYVRFLTRK
jgi:pimeloyl-ACP methyl ester carboxylesterase